MFESIDSGVQVQTMVRYFSATTATQTRDRTQHLNASTTCRAAAYTRKGGELEIIDAPIPDRIEPGALLVKVSAATICATDVHMWKHGEPGAALPSPVIAGHEMMGRIAQIGEGAGIDSIGNSLAVGDRVVWTSGQCGHCEPCVIQHEPVLCENVRLYMQSPSDAYPHLTGGFAEYCYVFPTSSRLKVPDAVSDAIASAVSCAFRTVIAAFDRLGRIGEGDAVLIQGSGPLGLFATALASVSGATKIIVIGGPAARLELAREWGADCTIDIAEVPEAAEREKIVRAQTGGRGADVVMEFSGVPAAFNEGMAMLRMGGRYLVPGQAHGSTVPFNPSLIMIKQATVIGSRSGGIDTFHRAMKFLERHADRFEWDRIISGSYRLEDINRAMDKMQRWEEIKPVITFAE